MDQGVNILFSLRTALYERVYERDGRGQDRWKRKERWEKLGTLIY